MKLYEVNQKIENLISQMEADPETGEAPASEEEIQEKIDALKIEKRDILEALARMAMNSKAQIAGLKAEEERLKKKRLQAEGQHARLLAILDRECDGKKTWLGIATVFYRKTSRVEFSDEDKAFRWLKKNGHQDCYKIPKPEISKVLVGKLIDSGEKVPGAEKVFGTCCYLK